METFDVVLLARVMCCYGRIEAIKADIEAMKADGKYSEQAFLAEAEKIRCEVTELQMIARG